MSLSVNIHKDLPGFSLDVDFSTNGSSIGLLGASGSGKSMTLRCIAGLDRPDTGKIILNGRTLFDSSRGINLPSRERRVGMLFQNYALFPHMTVRENIGFGLTNISSRERSQKIDEMISMIRLDGLADRYPRQISGGQQQRVALARALAVNPESLLLDEPFSALDDHLRTIMIREFTEAVAPFKGSVLFVTHNIDEAFRVCGSIIVLAEGKMKGQGETHELFANPPTFEAARITGCKNISHARKISSRELEAPDWGCRLISRNMLPPNLSHVGIRANHLTMCSGGSGDNIIPCRVTGTSESPFRMQIFLSPENAPVKDESSVIQWDIAKEKWEQIKDIPQPWLMKVNPEKMFVTGE